MLDIKELYWAAGFIEGEGSFNSVKSWSSIQVAQVQKEPLERLARLFGGSFYYKTRTNPKHNNVWTWYATGARARGIMMTIYSLMSSKRKLQIVKALAAFKGTKLACKFGHKLVHMGITKIVKWCLECKRASALKYYYKNRNTGVKKHVGG